MLGFDEKLIDRLPQDTINKLGKGIYRAVDFIQTFFPNPDDYSKKIVLGPQQIDFVDTAQYGFPIRRLRFSEVPNPPKGVILLTRRQIGKSILCGYMGGSLMVIGPMKTLKPPARIGIVSASEEESINLIDKTREALENSDFNQFIVGRRKVDKITLANGSIVKSHTCSHRSIRGPKYHVTFIDESRWMEEEIFFSAALPTVTHGDRWVAISTPKGSDGKLMKLYMDGVKTRPVICKKCRNEYAQSHFPDAGFPIKNRIWEIPSLPSCSCGNSEYIYGVGIVATPWINPLVCPIIDQEELRQTLEMFDYSPWARQEYLGEVLDEASQVILKKWIDKNINLRLRNTMTGYSKYNNYVVGVDYGRLHDSSCFCVTHKDNKSKKIVLDFLESIAGQYDFDKDYDDIHDDLKKVIKYFKPGLVVLDSTGLGYSQVERVQKELRSWNRGTKLFSNRKDRLGYTISRTSKPDLIGNLISLISQNPPQLELPPSTEPEIGELYTEMLRFECEIVEGGYIKYGTQNYHDDRLIAYALSLEGHRHNSFYFVRPKTFNYTTIGAKNKYKNKGRPLDWLFT